MLIVAAGLVFGTKVFWALPRDRKITFAIETAKVAAGLICAAALVTTFVLVF